MSKNILNILPQWAINRCRRRCCDFHFFNFCPMSEAEPLLCSRTKLPIFSLIWRKLTATILSSNMASNNGTLEMVYTKVIGVIFIMHDLLSWKKVLPAQIIMPQVRICVKNEYVWCLNSKIRWWDIPRCNWRGGWRLKVYGIDGKLDFPTRIQIQCDRLVSKTWLYLYWVKSKAKNESRVGQWKNQSSQLPVLT